MTRSITVHSPASQRENLPARLAPYPRFVEEIRRLIRSQPSASRREVVMRICRAWKWRYMTGEPRLVACRRLLDSLHEGGHIELPPVDPRERLWWRLRLAQADLSEDEPLVLEESVEARGPLPLADLLRSSGPVVELSPERLLLEFARLSERQRQCLVDVLHRVGDLGLSPALRHVFTRDLVLNLLDAMHSSAESKRRNRRVSSFESHPVSPIERPSASPLRSRAGAEQPDFASPRGRESRWNDSPAGESRSTGYHIRWVEDPSLPAGASAIVPITAETTQRNDRPLARSRVTAALRRFLRFLFG